jgi:ribosomal protein S18 acetylase RimI-like enzyme
MDTEITQTNLVIRPLPITSILRFHKLFHDAVASHFSYFPEEKRIKVLRDHTHLKILLATIMPRRIILGAYIDGQLSGYAVGSVPKDTSGQLYWLYVDPMQRGNNTGLALLSRMIRMEAEQGVKEVMLVTHDHRKYYQRQGFKFVRTVQEAGVDLALMTFRIMK